MGYWDLLEIFLRNSIQNSKFTCKEEKPFPCTSTHPSLSECISHETHWNKGFENLSSQSEYTTDNSNSFIFPLPPASLNCLTYRGGRESKGTYVDVVNGTGKKGNWEFWMSYNRFWQTRELKNKISERLYTSNQLPVENIYPRFGVGGRRFLQKERKEIRQLFWL